MKTIILARVSTEEQKEAGNSLPAQLLRLQKYAQDKNLKVIKEFSFDESAWKQEREEFQKIIEALKSSKEPMALCCDKIDRLIRNFTKDLAVLEELRKDGKLELHFSSDNIVLGKDSPASDLFRFQIGVSLANYYSNTISDNVKRAYEIKIQRGEWIGKAPIGYLNIKDEDNKDKDIEVDLDRSPYVIKIFEMYATGNYSLRKIKKEMDKLGLKSVSDSPKPLSISMVDHTLRNPFYYGIMRIKGKLYPHKYPHLISKHLFDKAQEVKDNWHKKPFKYASKPFAFRGLIKCADCGCTITGETAKGHKYYSCTNYHKKHDKKIYVKEEDLLKPIYKILKGIQLTDDKVEDLVDDLKQANKSENRFFTNSLQELRKDYDKLEKRISRLADDKYDGCITNDFYNKKFKEYEEKQIKLIAEMNLHNKADKEHYITANTILNLAQRAEKVFEGSEEAEKRQLLNFLLQNL